MSLSKIIPALPVNVPGMSFYPAGKVVPPPPVIDPM